MTSLSRHVPELAIEWALDFPEQRWRSIEGTLLFADISGFTALAERLAQRGRVGGEELVETLSRVFATMLDIAHRRGGMLLKFGGDALLLFFDGDGHALRGAVAAVEMRTALKPAARMPTSVGRLKLSMSVGIHSGDVLFFLVGATHRELILLGPAANTVVATENAADAGQILLSDAAAAALPAAAVTARADGRPMLRWRRPPHLDARPRTTTDAPEELIRSLFPRRLGERLARVPEPEHRVACMAFIKFSGTDALLAARGAAAVADVLDEAVAIVQNALAAEDVSLLAIDVDRDGGKFFLGSGVPKAHEDDEGRMLRALRAIADAAAPLPLQFGVHRGHVFAAEVGSERRAAYSAMGDITNTAARIASRAMPGTIYAHPSVLDESLTLYQVKPAGPFQFKGKKTPLLVYAVGAEIGTRRREGIDVDAFVGRPTELATLHSALDVWQRGTGGVVCLQGATGIGKSRLLREVTARVDCGTAVLALRGEPHAVNRSFGLFRDALRSFLGLAGVEPSALGAALRRLIVRSVPQLEPMLALVADVLHVDVEASPDVDALQPEFRADRRAEVLISVLESRRARLLFIVDDAQWVDASSAELLAALERACAERPWLMLVARRDSPGGYTPSSGNTLALAPMPGSEIRRLVELATEAAPLRPHETDEVVRRAGGNPLFAIEIVRAARDIGSLDAVPESLEAAMAAQVDALDSDARRVLRYASVLGRSFSRHVLAGVLSEAGYDSAPTALERLEEFLVADDADQMRFRSDVVRETTYQGLAYRQRTRLHAAAAHILKRSADPASIADTLAIHYSNTIEDTHTWRYARLAGDRARRNYANADAARFYELALGAARRMPLLGTAELVAVWTDLGDARELAGEFDRSLDAYRRALEVVGDDAPARAELLFRRARAKERAGRFSAALRDLTLGLRLLEGDGSVAAAQVRARLNSFAAMVLFAQDRPRRARRRAERALVQARAAAEGLSIGRALVVLDLADLAIDGPGDGSRLVEALEIFRERGDIRLEAAVRANLGFVHAHACRWEEAVAWLASARDLDGRSGDVVGSAYSGINIGEILINQNRLDEAQATLNDALRVVRAAEFGEGVAIVEIQLGRILVERGRCTEAYAMLARACIEFERIGNLTFLVDATVVQADAQLRSGQPDAAWSLLDRVVARAASETITMRPKVAWIRGRILSALGNVDEALEEFRVGLDAAVAQRLRYYEARIREARHAALVAGGCAPLADDLALAHEIYAALGVRAPLDG